MVKNGWLYTIAAFLFVGIVWGIMYQHTMQHLPSTGSMEDHALRGDSFGHLSALFAGLAFVGVIAALFLQREELTVAVKAQVDSREAQERDSRIAALAVAVSAKVAIIAMIDAALNLELEQSAQIGEQEVLLVDVKEKLSKEVLDINHQVDLLLQCPPEAEVA